MICLTLLANCSVPVLAQTLTRDLLRPVRDGFAPAQSPLARTGDSTSSATRSDSETRPASDSTAASKTLTPSRIGKLQTWNAPAAAGASSTGYDSLNRKRAKAKPKPGARKPALRASTPPPTQPLTPTAPPIVSTGALATATTQPPYAIATRAPVSPSFAGTYPGQPVRRRLKSDPEPFANLGFYVGSFLARTAVELSGGYDTNPGRVLGGKGSPFYLIAPELLIASDWSRHSLIADLRGSFTGYGATFPPPLGGVSAVPTNIDRPDFTGRIIGRYDVLRTTRVNGEARLRLSTDNPGSPNVQAGLAEYPVFTTTGATLGVEHDFNRVQVAVNGLADRTVYQNSRLTDGSSAPNTDRNFNQTGVLGRVSYDWMPGVKPFIEATADARMRDTALDRSGFARDSKGVTGKVGSTFEFSRLISGEAAIGYAVRRYEDPRLDDLRGLLTSASLIWSVSGLTTARFIATSSVDETTLPGVSGVLNRAYTVQVDHDFRRWLTGIGKFTYGTLDYQGGARFDNFYSASAEVVYRMSREVHIKGTLRHDRLESNIPGASNAATIVMLGVRLQH